MMADTVDEFAEGGAMSDDELAVLLSQHEAQAVGYYDDEISAEQATAIDYYYRRMDDLPAAEGTSSVVDGTVAIVVDNALAAILKPFVSADDTVSFAPRGPEDEDQAKQATEYVNYVFNCDNAGFTILHHWFKDALLTKVGIVKTWWNDTTKTNEEPVIAEDEMQLAYLREDERYAGEQQNPDGTFTVILATEEKDGRVVVENVPAEEFRISPFARSIEEAAYVAHYPRNITRSDLVAMGFDPDIVDELPTFTTDGTEEGRRNARYHDEKFSDTGESMPHKSQDIIGIRDEYVKIDFDGDGIAELRRIVRVDDTILLNEEVDDNPFSLICPVPMPHKVYGLSLADQTMDLQRISTVLWRQTLDNLYKSNNPRPVLPEGSERADGSTAESLMDFAPGSAIFEGRSPIRFEAVPFVADKSFPMLEYVETQQEARTGIRRTGQGLNTNAIKKGPITDYQRATDEAGKNIRPEMIARIFAETGVKRLFKQILALVVKFQPKARVIRLRNEWVEIDPRGWSPDMDLVVSVGLGMGDRAEQLASSQAVLETMAEIGQTPFASLIDEQKVYNAVARHFTAAGVKNIDDFLNEPEDQDPNAPPQPEEPSPEEMAAQAEMQMQAAKLQSEQAMQQAKMQGEQQLAELRLQIQAQENATKIELAQAQAAAQAELARDKAAFEAQLAEQKLLQELELAERRMQMQERMGDSKLSQNRPGGDLDK